MFSRIKLNTLAPVSLFVSNNNEADIRSRAVDLWNNLPWSDRTKNRRECFFSTSKDPYTYGKGDFARTYIPVDYPALVHSLNEDMKILERCWVCPILNCVLPMGMLAKKSTWVGMPMMLKVSIIIAPLL